VAGYLAENRWCRKNKNLILRGFQMEKCNDCKDCKSDTQMETIPNVVINITYNDNRVNEDNSNYIDEVKMDSEE
jgi:hypothetical protein